MTPEGTSLKENRESTISISSETPTKIVEQIHDKSELKTHVKIFGINLDIIPVRFQVPFLVVGLMLSYSVFFVIQEYLFRAKDFKFGGVFTLAESLAMVILGSVEKFTNHAELAFYAVSGNACSLYSLQSLNFPTWVLFKSSRVLVVMVGGVFILQKRYSFMECFGVILLIFGLSIFTLGDIKVSPEFDAQGIILVMAALVFNALQGNKQEKFLKSHHNVPQLELIIYSSALSILFLIPLIVVNGELVESIRYFYETPYEFWMLMIACPISYIGMVFVTALIRRTDALKTAIITSCRKALTVILSFLLFAKPWTLNYLIGFLLVSGGVFFDTLGSRKRATKEASSKLSPIEASEIMSPQIVAHLEHSDRR